MDGWTDEIIAVLILYTSLLFLFSARCASYTDTTTGESSGVGAFLLLFVYWADSYASLHKKGIVVFFFSSLHVLVF